MRHPVCIICVFNLIPRVGIVKAKMKCVIEKCWTVPKGP